MFLNRSDLPRSIIRSSAIRQTLALLLVFVLITTIAWVATYWLVVVDTNRLVEGRLETLADAASAAYESDETLPPTGPGEYLAVYHDDGSQQGSVPPGFLPIGKNPGFHRMESPRETGQTDYVVLIRASTKVKVIAGENVERLEETTDILLLGLQVALFASVLFASLAGLLIASRNQARLDKISSGLKQVSQGDLQHRINLQGPNDDLNLLANRIDVTTARLESAMTQMRLQSANIAHDLRTPLARLRSVLEEQHLALTERNEPVDAQALENALQQIDQIGNTFNALLRIARIESGAQKSSFERLDLGTLIKDAAEMFGPVVEDRGQNLAVVLKNPADIRVTMRC